MGQIYKQANQIGFASFYFFKPEEGGSYISFENAPSVWTTDDGKKYPDRKYFDDVVYNKNERRFQGNIHWKKPTVNFE